MCVAGDVRTFADTYSALLHNVVGTGPRRHDLFLALQSGLSRNLKLDGSVVLPQRPAALAAALNAVQPTRSEIITWPEEYTCQTPAHGQVRLVRHARSAGGHPASPAPSCACQPPPQALTRARPYSAVGRPQFSKWRRCEQLLELEEAWRARRGRAFRYEYMLKTRPDIVWIGSVDLRLMATAMGAHPVVVTTNDMNVFGSRAAWRQLNAALRSTPCDRRCSISPYNPPPARGGRQLNNNPTAARGGRQLAAGGALPLDPNELPERLQSRAAMTAPARNGSMMEAWVRSEINITDDKSLDETIKALSPQGTAQTAPATRRKAEGAAASSPEGRRLDAMMSRLPANAGDTVR